MIDLYINLYSRGEPSLEFTFVVETIGVGAGFDLSMFVHAKDHKCNDAEKVRSFLYL